MIQGPALCDYLNTEEWPDDWPQWVKGACAELDAIERRFPSTLLNGTPAWVDKMSLKIIQLMHPTTQINDSTSGPVFLGSMLGHLMWLRKSDDGLPAMMKRLYEFSENYDADLREKLSPEEYAAHWEELEISKEADQFWCLAKSFIRLLVQKKRIVNKCINSAKNQSPQEQAEFYAAYSNALKNPPMDKIGALTKERFPGTGNIYLLMVLNWRSVVTFTSGAQCHAWLCRILGERLVGSTHRIEKMCYSFRINFSHRKRKPRKKKRRNRKM